MNNATIGLILVTTIAVMLIVSANIFPTIQLRQANAAGPTASLKDNLRANLGSRNQHLNQQGNCMRTDGCTTSDVGQGTVGNDNSVTGFTDQSTTNITTANAATPGPAGAISPVNLSISLPDSTSQNPNIDVSGNNMAITWEERMTSAANHHFEIFFVGSIDAGNNLSDPISISSSLGNVNSVLNDVDISGTNVYSIWTAFNNGSFNIYFAKGNLTPP
jgi:hypothetical protein